VSRVKARRLLFTFAGGQGHFLPLLALARAARAAGHHVAFGCQAALISVVEQTSFPAFDTGGRSFGDDRARLPLLELDMEREYRAVRDGFAGRIASARAGAIVRLAEAWKPDLIVRDEMDFGAAVAAERLGIAHAAVLVIATGALARPELIAEPLNALRTEHGLPADPGLAMLHRYLSVSPFAPSLRDPAFPIPATARSFRSDGAADQGPAAPSDGNDGLGRRPAIYLTLGTVFNVESGDLFTRLLQGLARLPLDVVATVGTQIDPAELGPQADNVRIARFIDQWSLLPRCRLVVSHGGSGTVVGALAHGLPMLLLPMGADQPLNARRCQDLGVARLLDPMRVTPDEILDAAAAVLDDPAMRAAAARMQEEIAALPDIAEAVPLLERLA
jgi:UDP:flavonoid glycosyltransferase YjiC (YdhE family)